MDFYIRSLEQQNLDLQTVIGQLGYSYNGEGKQTPDDCMSIIQKFVCDDIPKDHIQSHHEKYQFVKKEISDAYSRNHLYIVFNSIKKRVISYAENGASWRFQISNSNDHKCKHPICGTNCATCGNYFVVKNKDRYPFRIRCQCSCFNVGLEEEGEVNYLYVMKSTQCFQCNNWKLYYEHDTAHPRNNDCDY